MFSLPKVHGHIPQLIYTLIVIIIIPATLVFNSIYILKSFRSNLQYELNNKAVLVAKSAAVGIVSLLESPAELDTRLQSLRQEVPEIKQAEVFVDKEGSLTSISSDGESTQEANTLNQLAWDKDELQTQKIPGAWIVAAPVSDSSGTKKALLSMSVSTQEIDALTAESTTRSLLLIGLLLLLILVLLFNYFRFFDLSVLFKKMDEMDRSKDNFIAMASHGLRTPLVSIVGNAYMMLRSPFVETNEDLKRSVLIIAESAKRQTELVENILNVTRIEQNQLRLQLDIYDVSGIINTVMAEYTQLAFAKQLKFEYQRLQQPIFVKCDKRWIKEVFANLIDNAIKFTPAGGVVISHKIEGKKILTIIQDTGVGLTPDDRKELFTKFFKAFHPKTKYAPGSGLGLWITKQLIEKMGGEIKVVSTENQGSQFIVSFPLQNTNAPKK